MDAKHTPGPWEVDGVVTVNGEKVSAAVYFVPANDDPAETDRICRVAYRDAHLIAAAPDMLAALQGVVRVADRKTDEFDAARAAIARAIGG